MIQAKPPFSDVRAKLRRFDPSCAPLIASWVTDALEAFWISPQTPPPLSAAAIRAWASPGRQQFVLAPDDPQLPIAYGELNLLNAVRREYWIGHLVVDPALRGRGVGCRLVSKLLGHAFETHWARRVSLVVFPENVQAIRCYQRAGMRLDGREMHEFSAYGRRIEMVRMCAGVDRD